MTAYRADRSRGARERDARRGRYLPEREPVAWISGDIVGRRLEEQTLEAKEGVRYG